MSMSGQMYHTLISPDTLDLISIEHNASLENKLRRRYLHCEHLNWNWISPIFFFPAVWQTSWAIFGKDFRHYPPQYN